MYSRRLALPSIFCRKSEGVLVSGGFDFRVDLSQSILRLLHHQKVIFEGEQFSWRRISAMGLQGSRISINVAL
jgi:hypothetical protein